MNAVLKKKIIDQLFDSGYTPIMLTQVEAAVNVVLDECAAMSEKYRQKVLSNPDDPSWTEHFADMELEILELKE